MESVYFILNGKYSHPESPKYSEYNVVYEIIIALIEIVIEYLKPREPLQPSKNTFLVKRSLCWATQD